MLRYDWLRTHGNEIVDLHIDSLRSSRWISKWLLKKHNLKISHAVVWNFLRSSNLARNHSDSMKSRVVTRQVNYKEIANKIDYKNRKANYKTMWTRRKEGIKSNRKTKQVTVSLQQLNYYVAYGKDKKMTKSDVYKKFHPRADQYLSYILRLKGTSSH